ncbi:MAG: helix-turn-helix domain-containing protein [Deferribacterales bacterium]
MKDLTYYELYKKDPRIARLLLVTCWQKSNSISATARYFKTTRNSVRKAVKRYKSGGEENLGDLSKRPKHLYRKTPDEVEGKVLRLRKKTNSGLYASSKELETEGLELSPSTIGNILFSIFRWSYKEILDFKTLPKDGSTKVPMDSD